MQTPGNPPLIQTRPLLSTLTHAFVSIESLSKFAILCIIFGWFFIDTLVVTVGTLQHGARFFDMSALIADPTRMFFGIETSFHRAFFSVLCVLTVLCPLLPHCRREHAAWLGYFAPLVLMVVCGLLLYSRTSSEFFAAPSNVDSLSGNIIRFANGLIRQGGGLVAKHVAVAAGGYLALIASVVLAAQGVRQFRARISTKLP